MQALDKVLYTAHATATGGRDGRASTPDGKLDVVLSVPKEMGGRGEGTNPEQLFAAGYSACFMGAMGFVAGQQKRGLPAGTKIDGEVDIGPIPNAFGIAVRLNITLPGMPRRRRGSGGCRAPGLPLLERHPGQHRRDADRGVSVDRVIRLG